MYSLDGLLVLALLIVCTCAYITKVPRLKSFFLSEKKGFFGVFYKGNIVYMFMYIYMYYITIYSAQELTLGIKNNLLRLKIAAHFMATVT